MRAARRLCGGAPSAYTPNLSPKGRGRPGRTLNAEPSPHAAGNRRRFAFVAMRRTAFAQDQSAVPIVFVHGDSDAAAIWQTQIWRFESNGYPRNRLFAISFTDPQARDDDTVAQANRSSTAGPAAAN